MVFFDKMNKILSDFADFLRQKQLNLANKKKQLCLNEFCCYLCGKELKKR